MPPNNGRKNRSIVRSEKPSARSASSVVMSSPRRSLAGCTDRTRRRSRATLSLSSNVAAGLLTASTTRVGERNGSTMTDDDPPCWMSAPGSNARRSSASRSSWRCASGYAVSNTWKPRSRRWPSTRSVRTRPPTPSLASSTTTSLPASCSATAQDRPARPAPTTTTGRSLNAAIRRGASSIEHRSQRRCQVGVREREVLVGQEHAGFDVLAVEQQRVGELTAQQELRPETRHR